MGLAPAPDVYQEKMSLLFIDLEEIKVFFDDILVLVFDSFEDHLLTLQEVFTRIRKANLQVNVAKSKFAAIEKEYLGFNISRQGVKPQEKKIKAILNIATPTNVHQVRSFLGAINHYKRMIAHCSHVATELTALTKKGAKFKWTPKCQAAFDTLKLELAK